MLTIGVLTDSNDFHTLQSLINAAHPTLHIEHLTSVNPNTVCPVLIVTTSHPDFAALLSALHHDSLHTAVIVIGQGEIAERDIVRFMRAGAAHYLHITHASEALSDVITDVLFEDNQLYHSTPLLNAFSQSLNHIMFTIRCDGIVTAVWGYRMEDTTFAREQVVGQHWAQLVAPEDPLYSYLEQALTGTRVSALVERNTSIWDLLCLPAYNVMGELIGTQGMLVDVTVNAMTWEELHKSNTRFNIVFRTMPIPSVIVELPTGSIVSANNRFLEFTAYTHDELIGHNLIETGILSSDVPLESSLLDYTGQVVTGKGEVRDVVISSEHIELFNQSCALLILRDVTHEKQVQQEILQSEKKFRTIFDDATDVIMIVDGSTGHIQMINQAVMYVMGYMPEYLIGRHFSEIFATMPSKSNPGMLEELRVYGAVFDSQEFRQADGTLLPMDLTATSIEWEGRTAVLVTLRDIRDRKVVQNALKEAEERLRTVISNAPVILCAVDTTGVVTFCEGRGLESLKVQSYQIVGLPITAETHALYPLLAKDFQRALTGDPFYTTEEINSKMFETYYRPIKDGSGSVTSIISVSINITERLQAQHAMLEAERALFELRNEREVRKAKEDFVSMFGHEFRTPLTVIMTSAGALHTYRDRLSPEQRDRHLERVLEKSYSMLELLNDMLQISQTDDWALSCNPEPTNVLRLATAIIQDLELDSSGSQNFTFTSAMDNREVMVDPKLVRYILNNLLSNAKKYTPSGGRIRFTLEKRSQAFFIQVEDTGIGIPPEDLPKIFNPFHRAPNAKKFSGTGLGLALVKFSVEAHNGTITIDSEVGVGTTFTVLLPFDDV